MREGNQEIFLIIQHFFFSVQTQRRGIMWNNITAFIHTLFESRTSSHQ